MDKSKQRPWLSAYGASVAIHVAILTAIAIFASNKPSIGADGMITLDLVGAGGGEIGGQGQAHMQSPQGDGGTNGDNRRLSPTSKNDENTNDTAQKRQEGLVSKTLTSQSHGEEPKNEKNFAPLKAVPHKNNEVKTLSTSSTQANSIQKTEKKVPTPKTMLDNPLEKRHDAKKLTGEKLNKKVSQHTAKEGDATGQAKTSAGGLGGVAGSVGAHSRQEGKVVSGLGKGTGTAAGSGSYLSNGDGSFTAMSSKGLDYKILFERPAQYPKQARSIGYSKPVKVTVRFLVGVDGRVEQTEVLTKDLPQLSFEEAALKSIRSMQFEPIKTPSHQPLKVWFKKTIIFKK